MWGFGGAARRRYQPNEDLHVKVREESIDYIGGACAHCKALAPNHRRAKE
jgi:hypothetical protein